MVGNFLEIYRENMCLVCSIGLLIKSVSETTTLVNHL